MEKENKKSRIGEMLRGQKWVELCGIFYPEELRSLASELDKNCIGLEKKENNVNQDGHNNT